MTDHLLDLERRGWQALSSSDPIPFSEEWLADDALIVVPGMVIDREAFLEAVAREVPWSSFQIGEPRTVVVDDQTAALIYRATAQRPGRPPFTGVLTSLYVKRAGRWKLVLHQQTPDPSAV
jgi:hypothetical protein